MATVMAAAASSRVFPCAAAAARPVPGIQAARIAPTPRSRSSSTVVRLGKSEVNLQGELGWVETSDAGAAIAEAQMMYDAGDFTTAVSTLEKALKLGGSGTKRDRAKPAELSTAGLLLQLACWHDESTRRRSS